MPNTLTIIVAVVCTPHVTWFSWLLDHTIKDMFFWLVVATLITLAALLRRDSIRRRSVLTAARESHGHGPGVPRVSDWED
jgi:hypothetical protein